MFKRLILILFAILIVRLGYAESDVTVKSSTDKTKITIGDRIGYDITVTMPKNFELVSQADIKQTGEWDVKGIKVSKAKSDIREKKTLSIKYTLTTYTTGHVEIPEISIKYLNQEGKKKETKTTTQLVRVESVMAQLGPGQDIKDINPPLFLKMSVLTWMIILVILAAIIAGFLVWYKKYREKLAISIPKNLPPPIPPDQVALEKLENLRNSDIIKEGRIKEFYISLTDIIRDYMSAVYDIETRDKTTTEIFAQLKKKEHDKKRQVVYKDFFDECDLVKFAKYRPDEKTCWQDFDMAKGLIK